MGLPTNKAYNGIRGLITDTSKFFHEGAGRASYDIAKEVAGGMHLKSSSFALHAGLGAAGGGAAGYLYGGDGDSMMKGAGLGVLGVTGWRGIQSGRQSYKSGMLGSEWSKVKTWGKGIWEEGALQAKLGAMELENPSTSRLMMKQAASAAKSPRAAAEADRAAYRAAQKAARSAL